MNSRGNGKAKIPKFKIRVTIRVHAFPWGL
jgi:hypothetical protein